MTKLDYIESSRKIETICLVTIGFLLGVAIGLCIAWVKL